MPSNRKRGYRFVDQKGIFSTYTIVVLLDELCLFEVAQEKGSQHNLAGGEESNEEKSNGLEGLYQPDDLSSY
jgi:hypothetical protein